MSHRIATFMRLLGFVLGGGFAVSVAVFFFVWASFDANHASQELTQYFSNQYQRRLSLGAPPSLHFRPFPVLELHLVNLSEPSEQVPFASADSVVAGLQLMPLLLRKMVVQRLEIRQPSLNLVRDKNGAWNAEDLLAEGAGLQDLPWRMELDSLEIVGGRLSLDDQQAAHRASLEDFMLRTGPLRDASSGAFDLRANLALADGKAERLSLRGGGRYFLQEALVVGRLDRLSFNLKGDYRDIRNVLGTIEIAGLDWQEAGNLLNASDARGRLQGVKDKMPWELAFELPLLSRDGASLQGRNWKASLVSRGATSETRAELGLPYPVATGGGFIADGAYFKLDRHLDKQVLTLDLGGRLGVDFRHAELNLADLNGRLEMVAHPTLKQAKTSLALRGKVVWHGEASSTERLEAGLSLGSGKESLNLSSSLQEFWPPKGRLDLNSPHLDLDALFKAEVLGKGLVDALPELGAASLRGRLELAQLRFGGVRLGRLNSTFNLEGDRLEFSNVEALLYGGKLGGALSLEEKTRELGFKGEFEGLALETLAKDVGLRLPLAGELGGSFALRTSLAAGQSSVDGLQGAIRWKLQNGALLGVDLGRGLRELKSAVSQGRAGVRKSRMGESTPLKRAASRFVFDKGSMSAESLEAANDWLSLSSRGSVDLIKREMDFSLGLRLLPGVSRSAFSELKALGGKPIPVRLAGAMNCPELRHDPMATNVSKPGVGKR